MLSTNCRLSLTLWSHDNSAAPEVDFGGLTTFNPAVVFRYDVPDRHARNPCNQRVGDHLRRIHYLRLDRSAFVRIAGHNNTNQIGIQATVA